MQSRKATMQLHVRVLNVTTGYDPIDASGGNTLSAGLDGTLGAVPAVAFESI
jgi:hypothetical protein